MINNDKNLFNTFGSIHEYMDDRKVTLYEEELEKMKKDLEAKDEELFNRPDRIARGYYSKDKKKRTIITQFGAVTITRRRYFYYEGKKQKSIFLLDQEVGINNYERVHESLKESIAQLAGTGNRYCDILKVFEPAGISAMTISNIIKKFDIDDIADPRNYDIKKVKVDEILNIQMDDTFPDVRADDRGVLGQRTRLVTMNTGHDLKKSTPRRKVVANKKAFTITVDKGVKIDTAEFIEKTMEQDNLFYDISPNAKIIFRGDGAIWITQSPNYLEKSFFMLDKYHSFSKLCGIFPKFKNPPNVEKYNIATDLFNKGDHVALIDYLKNVDVPEKKKEKLEELIKYFTNNADGIYNQILIPNDIGCHIESDV